MVVVGVGSSVNVDDIVVTKISAGDLTLDLVIDDVGTSDLGWTECIACWLPCLDELARLLVSMRQINSSEQHPTCLYFSSKEQSIR